MASKPPARATSAKKPAAKKKEGKKPVVPSDDFEKDGGEEDDLDVGMFEIQDEDDEGDQNFQGAGAAADSEEDEDELATPPKKSAMSRTATEQSGSKSQATAKSYQVRTKDAAPKAAKPARETPIGLQKGRKPKADTKTQLKDKAKESGFSAGDDNLESKAKAL